MHVRVRVHVHVCGGGIGTCATVHMESEDNLQASVLSSHHVGLVSKSAVKPLSWTTPWRERKAYWGPNCQDSLLGAREKQGEVFELIQAIQTDPELDVLTRSG